MKLFKNLFLSDRFFMAFGIIISLFTTSWVVPVLFPVAQTALVILFAVFFADIILLFNKNFSVTASRTIPHVFSLGFTQPVHLEITNNYGLALKLSVVDELPMQFQERKLSFNFSIPSRERKMLKYDLRPLIRGEYQFGHVNIFSKTLLGIAERRDKLGDEITVAVYPSVAEMKQFELLAMARISNNQGVKKLRRIGHSYEFEQIKNYVSGDDIRSINWKATSRRSNLMVNQYEDERSQQVYSIIDKSRSMRMPFNGLSLLDYAINTSLVISNVALQKQDKAGLITFSDKLGTLLKAERGRTQLRKILEALYKQQERNNESNYELLYQGIRHLVKSRSLIFLYTNFESYYSLQRVTGILRKINLQHLLVVIFFENTEITDYGKQPGKNLEDIYFKTIAQTFSAEKQQIVNELRQYGIQGIITRPEDLSINTVNKYLELKARGMI